MSIHVPHLLEPKSKPVWIAIIVVQALLLAAVVGLVVASVVQQHGQAQLRKAQHAAAKAQLDADRAHNLGACGMRKLTHVLIGRTQAALARPTTRPEDKPGFRFAIDIYQGLNDAQVTIPRRLDCRVVLKHP